MRLPRMCWTVLLVPLTSEVVLPCTCAGRPSACEAYGQSEAVFVGKVSAISTELYNLQEGQSLRKRVKFDVIESFEGAEEEKVTVVTGIGGGDCGYGFKPGGTYLVYAHEDDDAGTLGTGICTRTAPVDAAEDDLAFLRSLSSKGPEGRVFGYVATTRPFERARYAEARGDFR